MVSQGSVTNTTGYVNYVYNISARGTSQVASQLMGLSGIAGNILGQLAFQTSSYLTSTEGSLLSLGVVASASLSKATEFAMKFNQEMETVHAISGKTVTTLADDAMRMSNKFGVALGDMTTGLEALARAGVSTGNMTAILEQAMGLSKLEGLTLEQSINDLISTTNLLDTKGLDLESPEYAEAVKYQTQKITATSEAAPINAENIIHTLEHVGGYASSTNIDQDDLYAVIAQLGSKGTKGDMAGTSLRAFISAGQKDTAQRALARIGLSVEDLWKDDETIMSISDMKDVLDEAMESRGYTQQEKLEFYSDFAGYKQANQIMKIDTTSVREFKDKIDRSWDTSKKMETVLNTAQTNLQSLMQTGINFLTKVGEPFLPIVSTISKVLKTMIDVVGAIPFSNWVVAGGLALVSIKSISTILNKILPSILAHKESALSIKNFWADTKDSVQETFDIISHHNDYQILRKKQINNEVNRITDNDKVFSWQKRGFNVKNLDDILVLEARIGQKNSTNMYRQDKKERLNKLYFDPKWFGQQQEKRNERQSDNDTLTVIKDIREILKNAFGDGTGANVDTSLTKKIDDLSGSISALTHVHQGSLEAVNSTIENTYALLNGTKQSTQGSSMSFDLPGIKEMINLLKESNTIVSDIDLSSLDSIDENISHILDTVITLTNFIAKDNKVSRNKFVGRQEKARALTGFGSLVDQGNAYAQRVETTARTKRVEKEEAERILNQGLFDIDKFLEKNFDTLVKAWTKKGIDRRKFDKLDFDFGFDTSTLEGQEMERIVRGMLLDVFKNYNVVMRTRLKGLSNEVLIGNIRNSLRLRQNSYNGTGTRNTAIGNYVETILPNQIQHDNPQGFYAPGKGKEKKTTEVIYVDDQGNVLKDEYGNVRKERVPVMEAHQGIGYEYEPKSGARVTSEKDVKVKGVTYRRQKISDKPGKWVDLSRPGEIPSLAYGLSNTIKENANTGKRLTQADILKQRKNLFKDSFRIATTIDDRKNREVENFTGDEINTLFNYMSDELSVDFVKLLAGKSYEDMKPSEVKDFKKRLKDEFDGTLKLGKNGTLKLGSGISNQQRGMNTLLQAIESDSSQQHIKNNLTTFVTKQKYGVWTELENRTQKASMEKLSIPQLKAIAMLGGTDLTDAYEKNKDGSLGQLDKSKAIELLGDSYGQVPFELMEDFRANPSAIEQYSKSDTYAYARKLETLYSAPFARVFTKGGLTGKLKKEFEDTFNISGDSDWEKMANFIMTANGETLAEADKWVAQKLKLLSFDNTVKYSPEGYLKYNSHSMLDRNANPNYVTAVANVGQDGSHGIMGKFASIVSMIMELAFNEASDEIKKANTTTPNWLSNKRWQMLNDPVNPNREYKNLEETKDYGLRKKNMDAHRFDTRYTGTIGSENVDNEKLVVSEPKSYNPQTSMTMIPRAMALLRKSIDFNWSFSDDYIKYLADLFDTGQIDNDTLMDIIRDKSMQNIIFDIITADSDWGALDGLLLLDNMWDFGADFKKKVNESKKIRREQHYNNIDPFEKERKKMSGWSKEKRAMYLLDPGKRKASAVPAVDSGVQAGGRAEYEPMPTLVDDNGEQVIAGGIFMRRPTHGRDFHRNVKTEPFVTNTILNDEQKGAIQTEFDKQRKKAEEDAGINSAFRDVWNIRNVVLDKFYGLKASDAYHPNASPMFDDSIKVLEEGPIEDVFRTLKNMSITLPHDIRDYGAFDIEDDDVEDFFNYIMDIGFFTKGTKNITDFNISRQRHYKETEGVRLLKARNEELQKTFKERSPEEQLEAKKEWVINQGKIKIWEGETSNLNLPTAPKELPPEMRRDVDNKITKEFLDFSRLRKATNKLLSSEPPKNFTSSTAMTQDVRDKIEKEFYDLEKLRGIPNLLSSEPSQNTQGIQAMINLVNNTMGMNLEYDDVVSAATEIKEQYEEEFKEINNQKFFAATQGIRSGQGANTLEAQRLDQKLTQMRSAIASESPLKAIGLMLYDAEQTQQGAEILVDGLIDRLQTSVDTMEKEIADQGWRENNTNKIKSTKSRIPKYKKYIKWLEKSKNNVYDILATLQLEANELQRRMKKLESIERTNPVTGEKEKVINPKKLRKKSFSRNFLDGIEGDWKLKQMDLDDINSLIEQISTIANNGSNSAYVDRHVQKAIQNKVAPQVKYDEVATAFLRNDQGVYSDVVSNTLEMNRNKKAWGYQLNDLRTNLAFDYGLSEYDIHAPALTEQQQQRVDEIFNQQDFVGIQEYIAEHGQKAFKDMRKEMLIKFAYQDRHTGEWREYAPFMKTMDEVKELYGDFDDNTMEVLENGMVLDFNTLHRTHAEIAEQVQLEDVLKSINAMEKAKKVMYKQVAVAADLNDIKLVIDESGEVIQKIGQQLEEGEQELESAKDALQRVPSYLRDQILTGNDEFGDVIISNDKIRKQYSSYSTYDEEFGISHGQDYKGDMDAYSGGDWYDIEKKSRIADTDLFDIHSAIGNWGIANSLLYGDNENMTLGEYNDKLLSGEISRGISLWYSSGRSTSNTVDKFFTRDMMLSDVIDLLSQNVGSHALQEKTRLWRAGYLNTNKNGVGTFTGFTSTAFDKDMANIWYDEEDSNDYMIEILAPKGTIGSMDTTLPGEFLLDAGMQYYELERNDKEKTATVALLDPNKDINEQIKQIQQERIGQVRNASTDTINDVVSGEGIQNIIEEHKRTIPELYEALQEHDNIEPILESIKHIDEEYYNALTEYGKARKDTLLAYKLQFLAEKDATTEDTEKLLRIVNEAQTYVADYQNYHTSKQMNESMSQATAAGDWETVVDEIEQMKREMYFDQDEYEGSYYIDENTGEKIDKTTGLPFLTTEEFETEEWSLGAPVDAFNKNEGGAWNADILGTSLTKGTIDSGEEIYEREEFNLSQQEDIGDTFISRAQVAKRSSEEQMRYELKQRGHNKEDIEEIIRSYKSAIESGTNPLEETGMAEVQKQRAKMLAELKERQILINKMSKEGVEKIGLVTFKKASLDEMTTEELIKLAHDLDIKMSNINISLEDAMEINDIHQELKMINAMKEVNEKTSTHMDELERNKTKAQDMANNVFDEQGYKDAMMANMDADTIMFDAEGNVLFDQNEKMEAINRQAAKEVEKENKRKAEEEAKYRASLSGVQYTDAYVDAPHNKDIRYYQGNPLYQSINEFFDQKSYDKAKKQFYENPNQRTFARYARMKEQNPYDNIDNVIFDEFAKQEYESVKTAFYMNPNLKTFDALNAMGSSNVYGKYFQDDVHYNDTYLRIADEAFQRDLQAKQERQRKDYYKDNITMKEANGVQYAESNWLNEMWQGAQYAASQGVGAPNEFDQQVATIKNKWNRFLIDTFAQFSDVDLAKNEDIVHYTDKFNQTLDSTIDTLGNWAYVLDDLGTIFPPLKVGLLGLQTVIEGITKVKDINTRLQDFMNMGIDLKNGAVIDNFLPGGGKITDSTLLGQFIIGSSDILAKAMEKVGSLLMRFGPYLAAIGASLFVVKQGLDWSYQSHQKWLKSLEEEQKEKRSKSTSLQKTAEDAKNLAEKNRAPRQQDARDRNYILAQQRLDNANMTRAFGAMQLSRARNDTLWGEYGISAGLNKLQGKYESTADEYDGTSKETRRIKEATLANPFATGSMRQVAAYYDANQLAFSQMDEYKDELGALYDTETNIMKKVGPGVDARGTPQFEKALDKFVEATGITRDHAKQYLDYMQTEHNVDKATQAMQAQADTISAQTEMKIQAIAFGGNPADVLGLNGIEAQQNAMVKAQADMIKMELSGQLWWKAVWATITAPVKLIISPIFAIANLLGAIWAFMTGNWGEAWDKAGKATSSFNVFGEAATYWGAWAETESTDFNSIGNNAIDDRNRRNYGNAVASASGVGYKNTPDVPTGKYGFGGQIFIKDKPGLPPGGSFHHDRGGSTIPNILGGIGAMLGTIISILTTGLLLGGAAAGIKKIFDAKGISIDAKSLGEGLKGLKDKIFKFDVGNLKDLTLKDIFSKGTKAVSEFSLGDAWNSISGFGGKAKETIKKKAMWGRFSLENLIYGQPAEGSGAIIRDGKVIPTGERSGGLKDKYQSFIEQHKDNAWVQYGNKKLQSAKQLPNKLREQYINPWKDYITEQASGYIDSLIPMGEDREAFGKKKRSYLNQKDIDFLTTKYKVGSKEKTAKLRSRDIRKQLDEQGVWDEAMDELYRHNRKEEMGGPLGIFKSHINEKYVDPWKEHIQKRTDDAKNKGKEWLGSQKDKFMDQYGERLGLSINGTSIFDVLQDPEKMESFIKDKLANAEDGTLLGNVRDKINSGKELLQDPEKAHQYIKDRYGDKISKAKELLQDPEATEDFVKDKFSNLKEQVTNFFDIGDEEDGESFFKKHFNNIKDKVMSFFGKKGDEDVEIVEDGGLLGTGGIIPTLTKEQAEEGFKKLYGIDDEDVIDLGPDKWSTVSSEYIASFGDRIRDSINNAQETVGNIFDNMKDHYFNIKDKVQSAFDNVKNINIEDFNIKEKFQSVKDKLSSLFGDNEDGEPGFFKRHFNNFKDKVFSFFKGDTEDIDIVQEEAQKQLGTAGRMLLGSSFDDGIIDLDDSEWSVKSSEVETPKMSVWEFFKKERADRKAEKAAKTEESIPNDREKHMYQGKYYEGFDLGDDDLQSRVFHKASDKISAKMGGKNGIMKKLTGDNGILSKLGGKGGKLANIGSKLTGLFGEGGALSGIGGSLSGLFAEGGALGGIGSALGIGGAAEGGAIAGLLGAGAEGGAIAGLLGAGAEGGALLAVEGGLAASGIGLPLAVALGLGTIALPHIQHAIGGIGDFLFGKKGYHNTPGSGGLLGKAGKGGLLQGLLSMTPLGPIMGALGFLGGGVGGMFTGLSGKAGKGGLLQGLLSMTPLGPIMGALGFLGGGVGGMFAGLLGMGKGAKSSPLSKMNPFAPATKILEAISNKHSKGIELSEKSKKRLDQIAEKTTNNNANSNTQGGSITIQNININTDDDPEAIKAMFLDLIVELQEQVNPRLVSRTTGSSNASTSDSSTQTDTEQSQQQQSGTSTGGQGSNGY